MHDVTYWLSNIAIFSQLPLRMFENQNSNQKFAIKYVLCNADSATKLQKLILDPWSK